MDLQKREGDKTSLTALTQGWRRFAKTTTRLGEDQQLRVRDCGKDEIVVKHTLHLDMAARPGQQCMLCRYGGVCQVGFRRSHECKPEAMLADRFRTGEQADRLVRIVDQ